MKKGKKKKRDKFSSHKINVEPFLNGDLSLSTGGSL
jgi:hypothetical protein